MDHILDSRKIWYELSDDYRYITSAFGYHCHFSQFYFFHVNLSPCWKYHSITCGSVSKSKHRSISDVLTDLTYVLYETSDLHGLFQYCVSTSEGVSRGFGADAWLRTVAGYPAGIAAFHSRQDVREGIEVHGIGRPMRLSLLLRISSMELELDVAAVQM